jgi:hypothetical protein
MGLVLPSWRREGVAIVLVAAVGLAVSFIAAGGADAQPARPSTAVVPNGTYGAFRPASGEYVVFKVRNRRVRDLAFQLQITCETPDTPGSEQRFFSSAQAPNGRPVPANGKWTASWQERSEGRLGNVSAELKFGVRDVANFSVIVPEDPATAPGEAAESCNGVGSLRFHRGFELPAIP